MMMTYHEVKMEGAHYAPIPHMVIASYTDEENRTVVREMLAWCFQQFGQPKHKVHRTRWQAHTKPHGTTLFRFRNAADAVLFQMRWQTHG